MISATHAYYQGAGTAGTYVPFRRSLGYFGDPLTHVFSRVDVHVAAAQRNNDKGSVSRVGMPVDLGCGIFFYFGLQGDVLRLDNSARRVRDIDNL